MFQPAVEFLPMEKGAIILQYSVNAIHGPAAENNKFCVAVHYYNMNPNVDL
jgi:trehalose-6-phosphatase